MLAQRSCADIDAIDIDKACVKRKKCSGFAFAGRIKVIPASCADFARSMAQKKYDLIVSNPPYFINSLKCPDNKRSIARHTDSLPLPELVENARALLSSVGRIALVLPYEQLEEVRRPLKTPCIFAGKRT